MFENKTKEQTNKENASKKQQQQKNKLNCFLGVRIKRAPTINVTNKIYLENKLAFRIYMHLADNSKAKEQCLLSYLAHRKVSTVCITHSVHIKWANVGK